MKSDPYQLKIIDRLSDISVESWNALLPQNAGPFLRYEFLTTLEETGCVGGTTGWQVAHLILENTGGDLLAAMPLYLKQHSYGEFVFDWAWAQAYEQQGLNYFPKALSAIPFTPVGGPRMLIGSNEEVQATRELLVKGLKALVNQNQLSSAHILFPQEHELDSYIKQGFMLRDSVQFHWHNHQYQSFEDFLSALTMKRRKNIRRERTEISKHQLTFRHVGGASATESDWKFFYRCYENTYLEHRSSPYLTEEFFVRLGKAMPDNLHMIIANEGDIPIASSLLVVDRGTSHAYGRYWGALKHIPCLHFEVAYYQAIEYCIQNGIMVFEGGAQGEHKMARGFVPTTIKSAHWIEDHSFSRAIQRFLEREHEGMAAYVDELEQHSPLKSDKVQA